MHLHFSVFSEMQAAKLQKNHYNSIISHEIFSIACNSVLNNFLKKEKRGVV